MTCPKGPKKVIKRLSNCNVLMKFEVYLKSLKTAIPPPPLTTRWPHRYELLSILHGVKEQQGAQSQSERSLIKNMWSRPYTLAAKSEWVWQEQMKELSERMGKKLTYFSLVT